MSILNRRGRRPLVWQMLRKGRRAKAKTILGELPFCCRLWDDPETIHTQRGGRQSHRGSDAFAELRAVSASVRATIAVIRRWT